jgi:hypothetical protein
VFAGLLSALIAQLQRGYRRKIGDCVRLIDSSSVRLSGLSANWATFSAGVCGLQRNDAMCHAPQQTPQHWPAYVSTLATLPSAAPFLKA